MNFVYIPTIFSTSFLLLLSLSLYLLHKLVHLESVLLHRHLLRELFDRKQNTMIDEYENEEAHDQRHAATVPDENVSIIWHLFEQEIRRGRLQIVFWDADVHYYQNQEIVFVRWSLLGYIISTFLRHTFSAKLEQFLLFFTFWISNRCIKILMNPYVATFLKCHFLNPIDEADILWILVYLIQILLLGFLNFLINDFAQGKLDIKFGVLSEL